MKGSICTILCVALYLVACQEAKDDIKKPLSQNDLYKTIGEAIPFETGMEWIDNYKRKNSGQGRTESLLGYSVSSGTMSALLASVDSPVGVAFHYGKDMLGVKHIIIVPVDESMSLWSSIPGRMFVDANTGMQITHTRMLIRARYGFIFSALTSFRTWPRCPISTASILNPVSTQWS